MMDNSLPQRRRLHMEGYDYSQDGAYFVTVCVEKRLSLFGSIHNDEMQLNDSGRMIDYWWQELPHRFPVVELDLSVTMPDHLHGIVIINDPLNGNASLPQWRDFKADLSQIMDWFKTMTTNAYIRGVKEQSWPRFASKLWQRGFYDRIIRDEAELNVRREYVLPNPARWVVDEDDW